MSVVLDDPPPLMWHAELGRSLPDVWSRSTRNAVVRLGQAGGPFAPTGCGPWLLPLIAPGLIAYGVLSILEARWRGTPGGIPV